MERWHIVEENMPKLQNNRLIIGPRMNQPDQNIKTYLYVFCSLPGLRLYLWSSKTTAYSCRFDIHLERKAGLWFISIRELWALEFLLVENIKLRPQFRLNSRRQFFSYITLYFIRERICASTTGEGACESACWTVYQHRWTHIEWLLWRSQTKEDYSNLEWELS